MSKKTIEEINAIFKNGHIRIDHYSWPLHSSYRIYSKERMNKALENLLKYAETVKDDASQQRGIRAFIRQFHTDPENLPKHPSWDDKEFEEEALYCLFEIIRTNSEIKQSTARRLARSARAQARAQKDKKRIELYDRILFELTEASDKEFVALKAEVFEENL